MGNYKSTIPAEHTANWLYAPSILIVELYILLTDLYTTKTCCYKYIGV